MLKNSMAGNISHQNIAKLRILVAPLDWGLGHATRCIPVIKALLKRGCEVILASEGRQQQLLQEEFPQLIVLPLQGYRVQYAKTKTGLFWKILLQIPGLIKKIRRENKWLNEVVVQYKIDAVISDNRYGLYHAAIPCIFITHQLLIKTGLGKWADNVLQKKNYKLINKFSGCWVPDVSDNNNLAGKLSHPQKLPAIQLQYVGTLSRFKQNQLAVIPKHLLIVLSGPEPQRTLLEEKVINEISHYNDTATIVRGLPGETTQIPSTNMLQFYNHLSSAALNDEMLKAEFVIARSGYSTVMDIAALQKKSILIPTPGQTEQEYLGEHLHRQNKALVINQNGFNLSDALAKAKNFHFEPFVNQSTNALENAVEELMQQLIRP